MAGNIVAGKNMAEVTKVILVHVLSYRSIE